MTDQSPYTPPSSIVRDSDDALATSKLNNLVKAGRLLRLLGWLSLAFVVIVAGTATVVYSRDDISPLTWVPLGLLLILSIGYLIVGAYVKKGRQWAKVTGGALAVLGLLNFPVGTLVGGFIVYYLVRGWNEGVSVG